MTGKVKVGIIGSRFEADIHAAAFQIMPEEAEVVAVASPPRAIPRRWPKSTALPASFMITGRCSKSVTSRWSRSLRPTRYMRG